MSDEATGKAKGGIARAEALTPEQRSEIARTAAEARWGPRPLRATHKGNFQDEFGIDVECYVLNDDQKTAVISQRGMSAALGITDSSGSSLPRFLGAKKIAPYVGGELSEKLANPLIFQWSAPGVKTPPAATYGYDVTMLIDICKAIMKAEDEEGLLRRQAHIAQQAHVIVNASAKAGIKGLVYALTGYDATREEVIASFKLFVRQEAREYEKEFPSQLYNEWYRLYQLPKDAGRNKPWKFKQLTVDQVYTPLAKSNGKILELTRAQKANSATRHTKLHQFLSEIGVKALRTHLGQLLGIAQVSEDRDIYEQNVKKVFGVQMSIEFKGP
jgi:hypothetical protein